MEIVKIGMLLIDSRCKNLCIMSKLKYKYSMNS